MILYEYPFNERIRTYLRLEHLFKRLGELIPRTHPLDHHFALTTIFEIMDVAARADLKADVLKDIEKQKHVLDGYRGNPAISEAALDGIIAQLDRAIVVGPIARLELIAVNGNQAKSPDAEQLIEAQIPAQQYKAMGLKEGETLVVTPRQAKVFLDYAANI